MKGLRRGGRHRFAAAVINAITDAIGNNDLSMPATPERVWIALREADEDGGRVSEEEMYETPYHRPSLAEAASSSPMPPTAISLAADPHPDHEAAPRGAFRCHRPHPPRGAQGDSVTGDTVPIGAATTHAEVATSER